MKLHVPAFALAGGIVWSICVIALLWCCGAGEDGGNAASRFIHLYHGGILTPAGRATSVLWAFCDGLALAALFAWTYNIFQRALTRAQ